MAITINGSANTIGGIASGGLNADAVGIDDLNATGTASSSTYLRGDNSWAALSGLGKVTQLKFVSKLDTFSSSTVDADIPGLTIDITPTSSTHKMLVMANVTVSGGDTGSGLKLIGTTNGTLLSPSSPGSRGPSSAGETYNTRSDTTMQMPIICVDTPGNTTQQTYKVQFSIANGGSIWINRSQNDSDGTGKIRGCSTMTVMEVAP